ncbi:DUF551 domain-containing protein [Klebsiella pneumoniae]
MTKSTITREQLLEIIETDHVQCGEASYLASMALAAMDSESECLPLDYLQGHKDGLEWAAQLAEANHPETGDWLYDDPIELAKAIRKGTDMPPVQPVADREPDRNPVLAYADSYRDMAKQGVESVPIWSVITDLERNIAPLYRHAQPVPVVPYDFDFDRFNDVVWLECVASNPHMHSPTTSIIARVALELNKRILAGNSQVIPDGYVMVPMRLTAENGAKGALSGEFSETKFVNCPECFGDDECETCDGSGRIEITVPVTWTTIKEIWAKGVEHFAAAPQSPGSEPATVPGTWIPVSERLPEAGGDMIVFTDGIVMSGVSYAKKKGFYIQALEYDDDEPVDSVTHWMPLPAGPQEPKP